MRIVIPSTLAHKPIVKISTDYYKTIYPEASILIVCPSKSDFSDMVCNQIEVAEDADFEFLSKSNLKLLMSSSNQNLVGWYYQQLLKYAIVSKLYDEYVLVLDADTVVLRNLSSEKDVFFTSKEKSLNYYTHYIELIKKTPTLKSSAIVNFMFFKPDFLRMMLNDITQSHKQPWWQAIISIANQIAPPGAFSEYETYANWYSMSQGAHKEVPINIFRRGDLLVSAKTSYSRVVEKVNIKGYDAVAFELNHKKGFFRTFAAKLVLNFNLKPW
jgi:hypothetical protein